MNSSISNALSTYTQSDMKIAAQKTAPAVSAKDIARAEETAKEFEAVFVSEMMKPMFEDISTDGMFGGGKGEEVFRGMLLQEYGKMIAQSGSIGLSDQIKQQMILMQEQADNGTQ
jgi:Rod binding domain-containing protein